VTPLSWILVASAATIAAMLATAGLVLGVDSQRRRLVPPLLAYGVGVLLGTACLGLLPHAIQVAGAPVALATVLGGLVAFFVFEKLLLWRHCHDGRCDVHAAGPLIIAGDALHNFVDGIVIASAFLTAVPLGVATTIAVVAHELPQELGDFAILIDGGYTPGRALAWNTAASLTTPAGGLLAYAGLGFLDGVIPYVLALAAASFLYIAVADVMPTLHRRAGGRSVIGELGLVLAGVATALALEMAH
jgi:zinc and cadmium transporter